MYRFLSSLSNKYLSRYNHILFKWVFNISPMYRRSTGKVVSVSKDFKRVEVKIPISYKNRNYAGTIFGGSLFAATDPIFMVQLIQVLGTDYIVWDKSSVVRFKRPAVSNAYALFELEDHEIGQLKADVATQKEIDLVKTIQLKSREEKVFCEIEKTIYVADKSFYKAKQKKRN